MALSNDLLSQFVKITKDTSSDKKETTAYGTTVARNGSIYVRLDGSDILTPITTTADMNPEGGERVVVMIKNHTAIVTGNISSPSARDTVVKEVDGKVDIANENIDALNTRVTNFEIIIADKVTVDQLAAEVAKIEKLQADNVTITGELNAAKANISDLQADNVTVKGELDAAKADISELEADNVTVKGELNAAKADISEIEANTVTVRGELEAAKADISELEADDVTIKSQLTAAEADIDNLQADNINVKEKLNAAEADIGELQADNVTVKEKLTANEADISKLKTDKLDANTADIKYATIDSLNAEKGRIDDLQVNKLDADSAVIKDLKADVADIDTLIFGSASGSTIQTSFANAVIAQLGNAQIKSAMIDSVSASKISAGDINTKNVRVVSEDGKLVISDETIQISDGSRVRVQIGKDASSDYSINIWDAEGNLMFSKGGITDAAIKNAIIRNDMVSDDANISAKKLDIDSLFEEVNGSSKTIKSSKILLDDKNQTLDVAFTSMTSQVTTVTETANTAAADAAKAQSDIDNLEIGGRNLLLQSDVGSSNNNYCTHVNCPSELFVAGEVYTVSMCVTPATGVTRYDFFTQSGYKRLAGLYVTGTDRQIIKSTFTFNGYSANTTIPTSTTDLKAALEVYRFPNDGTVTSNTTVHWMKLEKGNKATDWTPAPEDVESDISDAQSTANDAKAAANTNAGDISTLTTKVTTQGTQISAIQGQISSKVWQQDIETEIDNLSLGGRNLIAGTDLDTVYSGVADTSTGYSDFYSRTTINPPTGTEYIVSFDAKADAAMTMKCFFWSPNTTLTSESSTGYKNSGVTDGYATVNVTTEWKRYWVKWTQTPASTVKRLIVGRNETSTMLYIRAVKLEAGNKATDWTPAPEDIEGDITSLNTKYSEVKQTVDGLTTTVASHTTELSNKAGKGEVTAVSDRVTKVETNLEGFKSTVSSTYTTKEEFNNLEIGGRNLIRDSKLDKIGCWDNTAGVTFDGGYATVQKTATPNGRTFLSQLSHQGNFPFKDIKFGEEYTISCEFKKFSGVAIPDGSTFFFRTVWADSSGYQELLRIEIPADLSETNWTKLTCTATPTNTDGRPLLYHQLSFGFGTGAGGVMFRHAKLEKGNKATDWTPAPEDIESDISTLTDRVSTAETSIAQNKAAIELRATKTEVTKAVNDISVGGRNYVLSGNKEQSTSTGTMDYALSPDYMILSGETVTVSFEAKAGPDDYIHDIDCYLRDTNGSTSTISEICSLTADYRKFVSVFRVNELDSSYTYTLRIRGNAYVGSTSGKNPGGGTFTVRNVKLEKGNKATDWTPAPEDIYTKTETDALIKVESDKISAAVTEIEGVKSRTSSLELTSTNLTTKVTNAQNDIDNLSIGGRNLLLGSREFKYTSGSGGLQDETYRGFIVRKTSLAAGAAYIDTASWNYIEPVSLGATYTFSFYAKGTVTDRKLCCYFYGPTNYIRIAKVYVNGVYASSAADGAAYLSPTSEWKRYSVTWTLADTGDLTINKWALIRLLPSDIDQELYVCAPKLELGNRATDWSPAPEDMGTIDAVENAQSTADDAQTRVGAAETIIQQLSDSISTLVTDENGMSLMTQTTSGWTFSTGAIQDAINAASKGVEDLNNSLNNTDATVDALQKAVDGLGVLGEYIKIGVFEDEPCIELGETDSDFKVLITNTRIMFREGSSTPTYISNQTLITNKITVKEELRQGNFVWMVRSNGNYGLIWKEG